MIVDCQLTPNEGMGRRANTVSDSAPENKISGTRLLMWINFNPSMDKSSHTQ